MWELLVCDMRVGQLLRVQRGAAQRGGHAPRPRLPTHPNWLNLRVAEGEKGGKRGLGNGLTQKQGLPGDLVMEMSSRWPLDATVALHGGPGAAPMNKPVSEAEPTAGESRKTCALGAEGRSPLGSLAATEGAPRHWPGVLTVAVHSGRTNPPLEDNRLIRLLPEDAS
ncbi:uncharacterized protein LOC116561859 [Sapajus apella]|uniref:Uncharacterized protein LOC116561859 n=1 Tax=Sapajus apella TaxID=9515 RepID=A0A6J3J5F6_SAPAP|nr:uncharacterized protein LOC116561859 [Sapajus apella]